MWVDTIPPLRDVGAPDRTPTLADLQALARASVTIHYDHSGHPELPSLVVFTTSTGSTESVYVPRERAEELLRWVSGSMLSSPRPRATL